MSVTFTKNSASVTLSKNPEHTSDFWEERKNQFTIETSTGENITFDNSRTIIRGILNFRLITKSEADDLRDFIVNKIRFKRFSFTITPPAFLDLGSGDGQAVTAYYDGSESTQGVLRPEGRLSKYNVSLPYKIIVTPAAGTADQEGTIA